MEPVAQSSKPQTEATPPTSKSPPASPYGKSKDSDNVAVQRALSSRLAEQEPVARKLNFFQRTFSERKPKTKSAQVVNGQRMRSHESGEVSITSQSSKEERSEASPKKEKDKEKKKKGGIKAPSFLKSKKKHKKEKEKEKEKKEKGASEM